MSQDKTSMTTAPTDAGKRLVLELQRLSTLTQSVEDADTKWIKSDAGTQDGATAKAELFSALYGFYTLTKNWLIQKEIEASAPPSQGKVERAREMLNRHWAEKQVNADDSVGFAICYEASLAASTQALTESSGQMDPEAAAILCTLGCVPDSTDLSETDAKVSVGFLRRLIESSGQGTDGAEALAEVLYASFWKRNPKANAPAFNEQAEAIKTMWRQIAEDACRALPLPVSADGSRKAYLEMTVAELQKERGTIDMLLQRKVLGDPRIGVSFGPKQPSDTEKS